MSFTSFDRYCISVAAILLCFICLADSISDRVALRKGVEAWQIEFTESAFMTRWSRLQGERPALWRPGDLMDDSGNVIYMTIEHYLPIINTKEEFPYALFYKDLIAFSTRRVPGLDKPRLFVGAAVPLMLKCAYHAELRERVIVDLWKYVPEVYYFDYLDEISQLCRAQLKENPVDEAYLLLGYAKLADAEVRALLTDPVAPLALKARLGASDSIKQLYIELDVGNGDNATKVQHYFRMLWYVGRDEFLKSAVEGLLLTARLRVCRGWQRGWRHCWHWMWRQGFASSM